MASLDPAGPDVLLGLFDDPDPVAARAHGVPSSAELEGGPVQARRPLVLQRPEVLLGPIALVPGQPVAFVEGVEGRHEPVPEDLGHDGGRGDRPALPVALRDAHLAVLYLFYREPVNQEDVGGGGQALDRPDHGQMGGPVDVQGVDLGGRGQAHAHRRGLAEERGRQLGRGGPADRSLESSTSPAQAGGRRRSHSAGRMTAAATTGPNSEPRPTSSIPATRRAPPRTSSFSSLRVATAPGGQPWSSLSRAALPLRSRR
ncbi:MAG: hypothetical protein MZV64_34115 [Ignavibacteriales bacterium]|nr:hypothetical protein [Ignavibacteriales bacterium]